MGRCRVQPHDGDVHDVGRHVRRSLRSPARLHHRHRGVLHGVGRLRARAGHRGPESWRGASRASARRSSTSRRSRSVGAAFPDPRAKARAIGIWTGIAAIGLAIGPTLGGVLTEHVGWRSIFLFNPFIGILAIVLTLSVRRSSRAIRRAVASTCGGQLLFIIGHRCAHVRADPRGPHRLVVADHPRVLRSRRRRARGVRALRAARERPDDGRERLPRSRRTTQRSTPCSRRSSASTERCSSSPSTSRTCATTARRRRASSCWR